MIQHSSIGIYGLGVMGQNLALNFEEKGHAVSVYNRSIDNERHLLTDFLKNYARDKHLFGTASLSEFIQSLKRPRIILIMVKAGKPVDDVILSLVPLLDKGDILIDGGNSHFTDTERRSTFCKKNGLLFVGMGVSGGEEGARKGPSLMPGGHPDAWDKIQPLLESVAARSFSQTPCCDWIGLGGAGHFVKMIHNGIEYADMQLISEAFHLMRSAIGLPLQAIADQFEAWNEGPLNSYLIEITSKILKVKDDDGSPLIDNIRDSAGQKGTGKWTAITALEQGVPLSGITESVFSRFISSQTSLRKQLAQNKEASSSDSSLLQVTALSKSEQKEALSMLGDSLLAARMMCHAEGFYAISKADNRYSWNLHLESVSRIWQGGCIIRSRLLNIIENAYTQSISPDHLLLVPSFFDEIEKKLSAWRMSATLAITNGIPAPVLTASLHHFDALNSRHLPANLIQAQRDFFGAHTYERTDQPEGLFFHTKWESSSY